MLTQQTNLLIPIDAPTLSELVRQAVRSELSAYVPPTPAPPLPEYLTRREVADLYRVSLTTLNEWTNSGFVPKTRKANGRILFKRDEVLATLDDVKSMKHKKRGN